MTSGEFLRAHNQAASERYQKYTDKWRRNLYPAIMLSHVMAYWLLGEPVAWQDGPCWPTAWTWPG